MAEMPRSDDLDRLLAAHRAALDAEITRSGALQRVRDNVLRRQAVDPLAGLSWQRIAAAVLLAGMLGGAFDLILPEEAVDTVDVAIVDAFDALDGPEAR